MGRTFAASSLVAVVALTSLSTGCGALRRLAGNDTVNLEKAEVKTMSVDIRRQQKTICPRDNVQMAIFADVVLDGDKAAKPVETWQGKGSVNKNDKLDFVDFAFQSDQGTFDRTHMRWFTPESYARMFTQAGLRVETVKPLTPFAARTRLLSRLTRGRLDHLFMRQIWLKAVKP